MRFSLWLWPYERWGSVDAMAQGARRAEELGFDSVSVSDHVVAPVGKAGVGMTRLWPDWSVLTSFLAARTKRIRFVVSVVVPYRPLLVLAKQLATLDVVSGGRLTLAAAVGWSRPEFQLLGVDAGERGSITDEYLRAMKILFTEPTPHFSGRFVSFDDIVFEPRCEQQPHLPIWVAGGSGPRLIDRLLRLGDGWMPMGGPLDDALRTTVGDIRARLTEHGRNVEAMTFRYTIGVGAANAALEAISASIQVERSSVVGDYSSPDAIAAEVRRYADAGFNELALNCSGARFAEVMEQLDWFGREVMPLL